MNFTRIKSHNSAFVHSFIIFIYFQVRVRSGVAQDGRISLLQFSPSPRKHKIYYDFFLHIFVNLYYYVTHPYQCTMFFVCMFSVLN